MIHNRFPKNSRAPRKELFGRQLYRSSKIRRVLIALVIVFLVGVFFSIPAATLPTGFTETMIASGLTSPTAMDFAPDGRLFICLQGGQLRVIKNGSLLATPFVTLTVDSAGERGLLGVTFDPNFSTNNFVYVYYTVPGSLAHNRVSRFTASGDVATPGSEFVLLNLNDLSSAGNHNGGAIHFGPDGKLYIAVGENANGSNSQTLSNLKGKMLRINADGTIPTDNPFFNTATGVNRAIWALGLRNPFTFAFKPGTTRMFINDVGESTWEEINDGLAGSNYGWPTTEGPTSDPNFRGPIFSYGHGSLSTEGCAITGGAFYNPTTAQFPASYVGKYFFADLCTSWIRVFDPSNNTAAGFASSASNPVDLKVAADGSLYYLARGGGGAVYKIQNSPVPASITTHPTDQTVLQGQPVTFQVTAGGTTPLIYQWQRNMVDIPGANGSSYVIPAAHLADNGAKFRCVVSNAAGPANSNEATLTVQPTAPILRAEENSDIAIALGSVTLLRDPFSLTDMHNFSSDNRTRVAFFVANLELLSGENSSAVIVQATDATLSVYPLTVEFVGNVPDFDWLGEVVVRLPDNLPANQDLWVTITLHSKISNKVRFRMK